MVPFANVVNRHLELIVKVDRVRALIIEIALKAIRDDRVEVINWAVES